MDFHLLPSIGGYTLQVTFPFGEEVGIFFSEEESAQEGAVIDLYSQNGQVNPLKPLSFFQHRDVKHIKEAVSCSKASNSGTFQSGFVLDLKDAEGYYKDAEAIRQS